ncbi:MAG: MBL fold metallo-hydrolase RNA specificity domain-containing protein [Bacteroidia bacterium]
MYNQDNIKIQFFGAAGTVTGSKHLLTLGEHHILIDCGLFQGEFEEEWNDELLPVSAKDIDIILLTHAHLDHTGYLPVMVKQGFKGKILGTVPTLQVTEIILEDCAKIAEEANRQAKKRTGKKTFDKESEKWRYNQLEVVNTVNHFSAVELNSWFPIFDDVSIRFRYVGHIIGATFIEIQYNDKTIVFSGDIGRENDLLLFPPEKPEKADLLVIESTYGDRLHINNAEEELATYIKAAAAKNGTIIIPSFAVERYQLLLYKLWQMRNKGLIPKLPIYMDSPMGNSVLEVFRKNGTWHKLSATEIDEMCEAVKLIDDIEDTYKVIDNKSSKIVIAGSGMVNGGRVLTYLEYYIENPDTTILLVGFQGKGTNGRLLYEGAKELTIHGENYKVNAAVKFVNGLSSHADQKELIKWMSDLQKMPEKIFLVHAEPEAAIALKEQLETHYKVQVEIAQRDM